MLALQGHDVAPTELTNPAFVGSSALEKDRERE